MRQPQHQISGALWARAKAGWRVLWSPFTLFRVGAVPVQVHSSYFIYPVGAFGWGPLVDHASRGLLLALVLVFVLSVSLVAHEFAHVLAARHFGIGTRRVLLIPFGAVAQLEKMPRTPCEMGIALAGPAASLFVAGMFRIMLIGVHLSPGLWTYEVRHVCRFGCMINLILAFYNLLPCFPMDGGRFLRSLLAVLFARIFRKGDKMSFIVATRIAVRYVAWPLALGLMALTLIKTHWWLDLALFPLLLLCGETEYDDVRGAENAENSNEGEAG